MLAKTVLIKTCEVKRKSASGEKFLTQVVHRGFAANDPNVYRGCSVMGTYDASDKLLAGQYYDKESGLHYNRYRYYDPSIGKYITADPIGLQGGLNIYDYALQNPINNIDYMGLSSGKVITGIGSCILNPKGCRKKFCNRLNALMHVACDGFVKCSGADSCTKLRLKKAKNQTCLALRRAVSRCHGRKNDPKPTGHQDQIDQVQTRIKNCNKLLKRNKCCGNK